ncbi:aminodeoxychorismate synthase component I [Pasteurella bettyae]|uniref:Para-aminobenzoate synthase component I n=1 Tax=Pasteurella bettyae CCUG 2042 TaxID=1095749 RepID=I3D9V9_9PAST|nr:aminodeoxychorismate synthase component I [Pasteurella bettyae]EIJ68502.1 para-aminobenzoate synthase component I [Pasteurella bettyae CCUG 2042]SUB22771.1 pabA-like protein [Pasteurella bettyae]
MNFNQFIQQANQFGKQHIPFFFLIDFEQQKPILCPIESAVENGIFFDFQGLKNFHTDSKVFTDKMTLQSFPISFNEYQQGFKLVKQQLQKGNSYLLNLTYPTEIKINGNLEQLFYLTQAPYKLWLKDQFLCFSPEPFIKIENNQIFTYPMKGTINASIKNAKEKLLNNPKEQKEHYTIVDLMRNDLAIVAQNIQVKKFRYIDKIQTNRSSILQTSSEIVGDLLINWQENIGTILSKLLPAGSISGAPKQKTVEIIQQAEKQNRGYYTGIFGIFNGNTLRSAVAIRFIEQQKDKLYFHSGGGITSQSNAEDEYQELLEKVYLPISEI